MRAVTYKLKYDDLNNVWVADTTVRWDRVYGKCDRRTHSNHNTLYTRNQLKAWGRRNGVAIPEEDLDRMPKTI